MSIPSGLNTKNNIRRFKTGTRKLKTVTIRLRLPLTVNNDGLETTLSKLPLGFEAEGQCQGYDANTIYSKKDANTIKCEPNVVTLASWSLSASFQIKCAAVQSQKRMCHSPSVLETVVQPIS